MVAGGFGKLTAPLVLLLEVVHSAAGVPILRGRIGHLCPLHRRCRSRDPWKLIKVQLNSLLIMLKCNRVCLR
jgi:hypothetical protein